MKGASFGLTSGIITTLGMMVGLHSGTGSKMVVLGGILTIAVADAFSDALGIHISEEATNSEATHKEVWRATIVTFFCKLIFASLFIIPVALLGLDLAIMVSIAWGLLVLALVSYYIAREQQKKKFHVIGEHLLIAVIVIVATHYIGDLIARYFS